MAIGKHGTTLRAGWAALAVRIQEATDNLTNSDVANRLSKAIQDSHKGSGTWAYYNDHVGDEDSGDVYYSCDGKTMCTPYSAVDGPDDAATKFELDMDNAEEVYPRVIYERVPDDDELYSRMEESFRSDKLYTEMPLYERFISKSERDAADSSDFAGKGKSYPILKPQDVSAAAHALGRAGSSNFSVEGIKKNIISIAKRKGWTKYLPKAWQDGGSDGKESGNNNQSTRSAASRKISETSALTSISLSETTPLPKENAA